MEIEDLVYTYEYMGQDGKSYKDPLLVVHEEPDADEMVKDPNLKEIYKFTDPVTGKIYKLSNIQDILDYVRDHRHDFIDSLVENAMKSFPYDYDEDTFHVKQIIIGMEPLYAIWWDSLPGWMKGPYHVNSAQDIYNTIHRTEWYDKEIAPDLCALLWDNNVSYDERPEEKKEETKETEHPVVNVPASSTVIPTDKDSKDHACYHDVVDVFYTTQSKNIQQVFLMDMLSVFCENVFLQKDLTRLIVESCPGATVYAIARSHPTTRNLTFNDFIYPEKLNLYHPTELNSSDDPKSLFEDYPYRLNTIKIHHSNRYNSCHVFDLEFAVPELFKLYATRHNRNEYDEVVDTDYVVQGSSRLHFYINHGTIKEVIVDWDEPFILNISNAKHRKHPAEVALEDLLKGYTNGVLGTEFIPLLPDDEEN